MDHWQSPAEGACPNPSSATYPITGERVSPDDWLQSKDVPFIFITRRDININKTPKYFYCSKDNKWLKLSGTIGNINKHIRSEHPDIAVIKDTSDALQQVASNKSEGSFSIEQKTIIAQAIKSFIASTGGSFLSIENAYLRKAFDFLGTRATFKQETTDAAKSVKDAMRAILQKACFISLAFDEWEDISKKRFLGVTAKAFSDGKFIQLCLALKPLKGNHADAATIVNTYDDVVKDYEISAKVLAYVSDNCNTMKSVGDKIGGLRFPCICHILELVLCRFIDPIKEKIRKMAKVAASLRDSAEFRNIEEENDTITIALYTEIRWTSLLAFINSMHANRNLIVNFQKGKKEALADDEFDLLDHIRPIVKSITKKVAMFENDEFANISLIPMAFIMLKNKLQKFKLAQSTGSDICFCADAAIAKLDEINKKYSPVFHPLTDAAVYLNPCLLNRQIDKDVAIAYIKKLIDQITTPKKEQISPIQSKSNFAKCNKALSQSQNPIPVLESIPFMQGDPKDVLDYWLMRYQDEKSKELAVVALSILSLFVSSCSVEREFSTCGRCKTKERMRLLNDTLEDQLLIMQNADIASKYALFTK